jgi:hypothetical protein
LRKFLNFGGVIGAPMASAARKTIEIGSPIFDIGNGGSFDFERQLAEFLTGKYWPAMNAMNFETE